MSGVYAAAVVPVGGAATLLSVALVEAVHHLLPGHPGAAVIVLANVLPALATGFGAYLALGRWAARRDVLAPGLVAHWLRTSVLYVAALWLGMLLLPDLLRGALHGLAQLVLWPLLSVMGGILGDAFAVALGATTARRRLAVAALSFMAIAAGVGTGAWMRRFPSSPMFATIGLPGPRADSERRCGHMYSQLAWHHLPTREITCVSRSPRAGDPYAPWQPPATVDALTRQPTVAARAWRLPDSVSWERAQDSVRLALRRRGGRAITCERPGRGYARLPHIRHPDRFWRFPGYTVRLTAYHYIPGSAPATRPEWLLQLQAYRTRPSECEFSLRTFTPWWR